MALPAILGIISMITSQNNQGGQQQPITQGQGYAGMEGSGSNIGTLQQPRESGPGTLAGVGGGTEKNFMGKLQTIGSIANGVQGLQGGQQQQQPYQMPYLRRRK